MENSTGWEEEFIQSEREKLLVLDLTALPKITPEELIAIYDKTRISNDSNTISENENTVLDKYGECPNCNISWDNGDIFEELCKKEVLSLIGDATKMAALYGWTKENKKRFTKVTTHTINDTEICMCPNCIKFITAINPTVYSSLFDYERGIPFEKSNKLSDTF